MADYIRDIQRVIGEEVVGLIKEEAVKGGIDIRSAEQFVTELAKKGEKVRGNFRRRTHTGNAIDGPEVLQILSDWWNHGHGCNDQEPKETIMKALKQAGLHVLLSKIRKLDRDALNSQNLDENHNPKENHFNEDSEDKTLISGSRKPSVFRRMSSLNTKNPNWQKIRSSVQKKELRKESSSKEVPASLKWREAWRKHRISALAALSLALLLCLCYFYHSTLFPSNLTLSSGGTRSVRIGFFGEPSQSVDEIHGCLTQQVALPNLGTCIQGHTGIQIPERSILVCGGTNDEGHDPRTCLLLELGSQNWVAFNYTMNEPRIQAHSKINGKKVLVIGGIDSHVNKRCKTSQEVFNLEDPERGWQLEPSEKEDLCFPTDVILEIPCE